MSNRIAQWRTFLYVSLVFAGFGMVLGLLIGLAAMIVGSLLFTFENKYTLIAILASSTLFSGLFGLIVGIFIENKAYQESKRSFSFLGDKQVEVTADVRRSFSGTRQLRMTKIEVSEHHHLEFLDPESIFVLESNVCGKIKPIPVKAGKNRWVAIMTSPITDVTGIHFLGLPPELTNDVDNRTLLPAPKILTIELIDNDVFLFRFTKTGDYAGDTWHQSVDEAKKQAAFEYGIADDVWQMIPDEVDDVVRFVSNM